MSPIHPMLAPLAQAARHMPYADCAAALRAALKTPGWLRPEHRVGDPTGYMRHLLYVDPADHFVITAITWLPGQAGGATWCVPTALPRASSPRSAFASPTAS
jgi:predicted metal-dependent enzyme (double-stranded beta helix superfamily)